MNHIAKTTLILAGVLVAFASSVSAKTTVVAIKVSPKQFVSSCQGAGGTASGGQGVINCQSGGTLTSCAVKDGKTTDCYQQTRSQGDSKGPRQNTGGNQSAGDTGANDGGGRPDSASGGNGSAASSASSGNSGGGNTIN